jgi:hypothetical protein
MNGELLNRKLAQGDGRLSRMLKDPRLTDETLVRRVYLLCFCRPPSAAELATAKSVLAESTSRATAAQDFFWAMLNSKEFLFNH